MFLISCHYASNLVSTEVPTCSHGIKLTNGMERWRTFRNVFWGEGAARMIVASSWGARDGGRINCLCGEFFALPRLLSQQRGRVQGRRRVEEEKGGQLARDPNPTRF